MQTMPKYMNILVDLLTMYIERRVDHFTLQTYGGKYINGPYVQALQEHDNMLLIEVASNKFLEPQLSIEAQHKLRFLGWNLYVPDYLPNYARLINQREKSPRQIAEIMVKPLYLVYGVDHTFSFEIAPQIYDAKVFIEELGLING
jgi:hypothetical protein